MRTIETEILVLGGGATGLGVLRDLAMRGFKTILVEKGDLTNGTTGRYHGLLHSGGRYVVKDPQAARECILENRILRRIMPQCIEDTGGFFVLTPWDEAEYVPRFLAGCLNAGIPVEEITIPEMLREEPLLNPQITRCFRVPDASADSFLAADLTAESARQYGAQVLRYHQAVQLLTIDGYSQPISAFENGNTKNHRVCGALCRNLITNEEVIIRADMVVNALGAWVGQIASTIGIHLPIIPGKGIMVAINHRILNTVVNRCKLPADGDIIVPAHTVAIIGTTDVPVDDPDHFAIEPWEVQRMLTEGEKLVPGLMNMRILRAWAGVRPLYKELHVNDTRDVSRAYVLIDHEQQDNVTGLVTITSGKWTTFRKMAEVTVDMVCRKLGVRRPCRTHLEELPQHQQHGYHTLGARLADIEHQKAYGELVCECELATYQDVEKAILEGQANTIDDIRRDVRLGMGPCQGGFCTYRVAGILHQLRHPPIEEINRALHDFLQERWKGLMPILWGQQLRQECLDELIYFSVLNADHLPIARVSPLSPTNYAPISSMSMPGNNRISSQQITETPLSSPKKVPTTSKKQWDVLVIGGGLAGLTSAWQAARRGLRVLLVTQGWGSLYWNTGCIDILGHYPIDNPEPIHSVAAGIASLVQDQPLHPYSFTGIQGIKDAVEDIKILTDQAGYALHGSLDHNWLLPTALGALRPTCLAPETMIAGDLSQGWKGTSLIVGFMQFRDFYPAWIVENLRAQGVDARECNLDLPRLQNRRFTTGRILANLFEEETFRQETIQAILPYMRDINRVGFPAVLGLDQACEVKASLEAVLGVPVFEIPTLPPSIPGMRLNRIFVNHLREIGVRLYEGAQVVSVERYGDRINGIIVSSAARKQCFQANQYILATGGILGGGILAPYNGYAHDTVFNMLASSPSDHSQWLKPEFFSPHGHPIFRAGLPVNSQFMPIDQHDLPLLNNLFAAGLILANAQPIREHSLEGIALSTGYAVGKMVG